MFKSAHAHDDGTVFYFDEMGNKYAAIGGSLAWRINNPGLVHSHCSRKFGSIGNLGHYAIFPDPQNGREALSTWIRSKKYFNSSLKVVAKHYQPKNPEGCVQKLSSSCSISSETKIKDLNQEELQRLLIGIEKLCGYTSTNNEIFSLLPKIIAKIENPTGDTYLIGNNAVLSKKEAIEWVQSHRLDGVIVRERNGTIHLRSRPNHCIWDVSKNKFTLLPSTKEINTLARVVGEHRPGQCIWSFINGIDNTKEEALASTELISKATNGERVLCMPNDTILAPIDLIHCLVLKTSSNTPIIPWTVKFLQHLLSVASEENESPPVILFLHSQGAILVEHALKSLSLEEKKQLRIFTFGGGSFLPPGESHADSHNYASAADFVCRFGSPHLQLLALKRYLWISERADRRSNNR
jgi:hypothetical protein